MLTTAAVGGVAASQFPEFAQQYRQRLGGALDEMRQVVADFDADALRNELTREEALHTYGEAAEPFLQDRGVSMTSLVSRYEWLSEQRARLETAPPLMRPLVVLSGPDAKVAEGAWADFEPAVPVTASGFAWAAIGFLVAGGIAPASTNREGRAQAAAPPNGLIADRSSRPLLLVLMRPSTFGAIVPAFARRSRSPGSPSAPRRPCRSGSWRRRSCIAVAAARP